MKMKLVFVAIALYGLGGNSESLAAGNNSNSTAPLIELVKPRFNGDNTFTITLEVGNRSKEFIERCAKGGHVFVGELNNREFTCALKNTNDEYYRVDVVGLNSAPVSTEKNTECYRDEIFTISSEPLGGFIKPAPLSETENKVVVDFVKKQVEQPKSDGSKTFSAIVGLEKNLTEYECIHAEKPIKINVSGQVIYFMPAFLIGTPLDENILTAVVSIKSGQYRLLGTIDGCIARFGADLDKDGYPEVITKICSPNEYQMYSYYKYIPGVKLLSALYQ